MTANQISLYFLTQNQNKFLEAKEVLKPFSRIELIHLNMPKVEIKDDSYADAIKTIAIMAAKKAARKYNKLLVVEDSGIFFNAYDDFPGMNTKWLIKKVGYKGILNLLQDMDRTAYFRTVLVLADPSGKYKVFEGTLNGYISKKVYEDNIYCMDYDRIFIPEGSLVPFVCCMDTKKNISHRSIAFQKLADFLLKGGIMNE